MNHTLGGLSAKNRKLLGALLKASHESFTIENAADILNVSRYRAASLLAIWTKYGWVCRIQRGLYIPIPIQSSTTKITPEEPWLIAHQLFSPCYIGGWTAVHHWGLTEQLFNSVYVMTSKKVHQRELQLQGVQFKIKTILSKRLFGTTEVWCGKTKVAISDLNKTVVDALDDPGLFGGARALIDILCAYFRSQKCDPPKLLEYAKQMRNSAIFKRLGYLAELIQPKGFENWLPLCQQQLKQGYSFLDPAIKENRLATKWNLWVPRSFSFTDVI